MSGWLMGRFRGLCMACTRMRQTSVLQCLMCSSARRPSASTQRLSRNLYHGSVSRASRDAHGDTQQSKPLWMHSPDHLLQAAPAVAPARGGPPGPVASAAPPALPPPTMQSQPPPACRLTLQSLSPSLQRRPAPRLTAPRPAAPRCAAAACPRVAAGASQRTSSGVRKAGHVWGIKGPFKVSAPER